MDEQLLELFASALSDFNVARLAPLLIDGLDPNICLERLLPTDQRNPDNPLCAWLLLASILFAEDDRFKPLWPQAWATLELLVDHGLDLSAPASVAPHLQAVSRLAWLSRQHPQRAEKLQSRYAHAQQSLLDRNTATATSPPAIPARL